MYVRKWKQQDRYAGVYAVPDRWEEVSGCSTRPTKGRVPKAGGAFPLTRTEHRWKHKINRSGTSRHSLQLLGENWQHPNFCVS